MSNVEYREYHDDTRMVVIRDGAGAELRTRPYTAEENSEADAKAQVVNVEETLKTESSESITALKTSMSTLQAIVDAPNAAITPNDTKTVARETIRVARQVLRLTRLQVKAFDSTT
jgi:hypothetical protein